MENLYIFLLLISCISCIHAQKFKDESPYMLIRLMDIKLNEWKPDMLDRFEKVLDAELKYTDDRKGVECKSIDFEQEAGYPKQDSRFLDLSIRGLCKDYQGNVHNIDKGLMIVAIERNIDKVNAATSGAVFSLGDIQIYKHSRNILNLIIIPTSVILIILLFAVTFFLRRLRRQQKKRHILAELKKNKEASAKKGQTVPNTDPYANEKQRLLQLDPNVVGNASDTLGSPKEFTNDQYPSPSRTNPPARENQGPPITPSKDNRTLNYNQDKPDRGRGQVLYENEPRLLPSQCQPQYEPQYPDMIPMQEQAPRVVVRTVREDPTTKFVPIPVQVERSGLQQRYTAPPYHSDPYYRNVNA